MIRRLALMIVVAVAFLGCVPAAAHEGAGTIEVLSAEPTGADARIYRVRVVFVADGHLAPEATVTATIVDQPGTVPVSLAATGEEGIYEGTVRFPGPGEWTVRLTSLRPIASSERTETIAAPAPDVTTTTVASTTTETTVPIDDEDRDGGGGASATTIAVLIVGLGAGIAAVGAINVARRRRPPAA